MDRQDAVIPAGVPLFTVKVGTRGRIGRIGGKEELRRHLFDLGFTIGECLTVMQGSFGDFIVDIRGSRIAIDRSISSKIMISPEAC